MDWDGCFIHLSQMGVMANDWGRRLEVYGSLRSSEAFQHLCFRRLNDFIPIGVTGAVLGSMGGWHTDDFIHNLTFDWWFCLSFLCFFFYMSALSLSLSLFNGPQVRTQEKSFISFYVFSCWCKLWCWIHIFTLFSTATMSPHFHLRGAYTSLP